MASTYSDLKVELIGTGEQTGTWGTTTNNNLSVALGEAITGSADVSFSGADVTLTLTDTNAAQTARNLRLNLTGTSGGARNLILGSGCQIEKLYLVNNGLADAVTVKNTTGTGIAVPAGKTMFVYNNGTNVVDATTHLSSLTTGALSASGAVTFTANTASTSTTTGTAVITGGLGVSGRINAANFDGIVGANTAAAGSFTTLSASGVATFSAGTVSAPAITTSGDTNTGIFFPAADTIAFTTDGTDKLRINSSGNVGIAVTSSAWSAGRAIEIASVGTGIWGATGSLYTTAGYYFNSGDKFAITGNYAVYSAAISADASFRWYSSTATGTAGNAATMSERMRIDSSGNVGIGTSSPYTPLDVNGYFSAGVRNTTNFPTSTAAQHYFGCSPSDLARNNIVFNINGDNTTPTRLRFYKSRGTSASPTATNSGDLVSDLQTYTYDGSGFIQASGLTVALSANSTTNNVSSYMSFATNGGSSSPTERMRITSGGELFLNTTTEPSNGTSRLGISNTGQTDYAIAIKNTNSSTNDAVGFFNNSGTRVGLISYTTSATTYGTSSDYRLKENIAPMTGALAKVSQLKPVTYKWKIDGSDGQGFIAHELQAVVPDAVTGEKDAVDAKGNPVYQSIDTSFLVATLTSAIQELHEIVKAQAAEIALLKSK